jgi:hypothetical protein
MLANLAKVAAQADAIFEAPFPKTHGGERREGHEPATGLERGSRVSAPSSGGDRFVPTADIRAALKGCEADLLDALGIRWREGGRQPGRTPS